MIVRLSIVGTITTHFEKMTEIANSILPKDVVFQAKVRVIGEEKCDLSKDEFVCASDKSKQFSIRV